MEKNFLKITNKILGFILSSFITIMCIFFLFKDDILKVFQKPKTKEITIEYETVYIYNDKLPSNITKLVSEGIDGTAILEEDKLNIIIEMQPEIIEQGTGKQGIYYGYLTGYGADCDGCTGALACKTAEGKWLNLYESGPFYEDKEFGTVRMLAAAFKQFPCGTIIQITDNKHEPFTGVVMDTGIAMRKAYKKGKVHIDVAFPLEHSAGIGTYTDFSGTVKFEVQRWGW